MSRALHFRYACSYYTSTVQSKAKTEAEWNPTLETKQGGHNGDVAIERR